MIVILLSVGVVNASDMDGNVSGIEVNQESIETVYDGQMMVFDDYLSVNPNIGDKNGNYSLIICDENYTIIEGFNDNFSSNLPSYYLSNYSSVKDQGRSNNCWAFAAISTLESNI